MPNPKRAWLMKTEPSVFSFEDLVRAPGKKTSWEGVRNYQARNFLRNEMKLGDAVLIYHSNTEEPAIMGLGEVCREGYPDLSALDPKSPYFDEKAKAKGESPWSLVDVRATHRMTKPVTRDDLRKEKSLQSMMVLKKGARLSIQPVTSAELEAVKKIGKPSPI